MSENRSRPYDESGNLMSNCLKKIKITKVNFCIS
jgi:hypothetical protein